MECEMTVSCGPTHASPSKRVRNRYSRSDGRSDVNQRATDAVSPPGTLQPRPPLLDALTAGPPPLKILEKLPAYAQPSRAASANCTCSGRNRSESSKTSRGWRAHVDDVYTRFTSTPCFYLCLRRPTAASQLILNSPSSPAHAHIYH